MRDWFLSLQSRERIFVTIGALAVIATLAYSVVWSPLQNGWQQSRDDVARKSALLAQAEATLALSQTSNGARPATPTDSRSLTVLIANTVSAQGLGAAYKSSSPSGNQGLRVSLENASFDQLIAWLGVLQNDFNIRISAGSITRRDADGRVDASLVLERS